MGFWSTLTSRIRKNFSSGGWDGKQPDIWNPLNRLSALTSSGQPSHREDIENSFESYVGGAYKSNGPIFACMQARQMVFAEATFQWRRFVQDTPAATAKKPGSKELADMRFEWDAAEGEFKWNHGSEAQEFTKGRPGDLFGNGDLKVLENPWPGGTTGELLQRMIQDADLAGNFYGVIVDDDGNMGRAAKGPTRRVARLRPDWVTILVGTKQNGTEGCYDPDARVLAYIYHPRGGTVASYNAANDVMFTPDEVCHFSPNPDPIARFRGMSWLTPIIREIQADSLATVHKKKFLEDAAVPNIVVRFDKDVDEDTFDEFVEKFNTEHKGAWNAYRTLFLMGGADVTPLTHDFAQMQFTQSQGKSESRIAAAAGVPSSWVGFSEGLTGSGLNSQGVYAAARRRFADGTIRPLWRMAAASLQNLLNVPAGAHLWYDERGIAFLREDAKDLAEIMRINMNAVDAGIKSGFKPDAVVTAIRDNAIERLLGEHTGLVSVQMMMPQMDTTLDTQETEATIRQIQATAIVALASQFDIASIAKFLESGDASVLKKDPKAVAARAQAALPPGTPPPGQGPNKPPAPGNSNNNATGGTA
jgi:phage portal protein BeeE/CheY-like chemotaxis protein